jgi:2-methylisocitrate lyase-like PEP mutase family enzyme
MSQNDRATEFHRLHANGLLLLANAWDAGSARLIASLGAKAIATTSAGVAWAQGYADGSRLPVQRLVENISAIARVTDLPLSVDVEDGYSDDPSAVAEHVARVIDAGAIGINLEDGNGSPDLLCAKIEQIKRVAQQRGIDLFVNARTDVYLRGLADGRQVEETLARAERYRAAGTDGLFVPGISDATQIRDVVAGTPLPLNVLAVPGLPPVDELESLGVRRLSAGSSLSQAAYGRVATLATRFLRDGVDAALFDDSMDYGAINALFD